MNFAWSPQGVPVALSHGFLHFSLGEVTCQCCCDKIIMLVNNDSWFSWKRDVRVRINVLGLG